MRQATTEPPWLERMSRKSWFENVVTAATSVRSILRPTRTSFVLVMGTEGGISLTTEKRYKLTFFGLPVRIESKLTVASSSDKFPAHGTGGLSSNGMVEHGAP